MDTKIIHVLVALFCVVILTNGQFDDYGRFDRRRGRGRGLGRRIGLRRGRGRFGHFPSHGHIEPIPVHPLPIEPAPIGPPPGPFGDTCSRYGRERCRPRVCHLVRHGNGLTSEDCLTEQEAFLLFQASRGGATGPGTGINVEDRSNQVNVVVKINNENQNIHNQANSSNTNVRQSQVAAPAPTSNGCVPCIRGRCHTPGHLCVYDTGCPDNFACRIPVH